MARYEVGIHVSYTAHPIIEADSEDEANSLATEMGGEELWALSVEQGDAPWDNDIEIEWVQEARK